MFAKAKNCDTLGRERVLQTTDIQGSAERDSGRVDTKS
jgi:hypothetical protein